ncbi:MAG: hypothetical protein HQK91_15010 [Nitrospirae bacterium]|nr:hypothetical protein [Nitrospirota bacterium]
MNWIKNNVWNILGFIGLSTIIAIYRKIAGISNYFDDLISLKIGYLLIIIVVVFILGVILGKKYLKSKSSKPDESKTDENKTDESKSDESKLDVIIRIDRKNPKTYPSAFLENNAGSFSIWVYIDESGKGIRKINDKNNYHRYIFAHDTNKGESNKVKGNDIFINVVSISREIKEKTSEPFWSLWITNNNGGTNDWSFDDTVEIGWHHFLLRWDKSKPRLGLLLNGEPKIELGAKDDYLQFWPNYFNKDAFIGSWTSLGVDSFINTNVTRIQGLKTFMTDEELKLELTKKPVDKNNK